MAYAKVKNPKVGSFLRAPEDLEGFRSQKNLIFQNAQIKSVDHKFKSFAINNRPQISIDFEICSRLAS